MAPTIFPVSTVVVVDVSTPPAPVNEYNTSNLALFTDEIPANSFGSLGYALYADPTQVGVDFGTGSKTFKMANAIFSQNPNILLPGGQLIIILLLLNKMDLALSGIPASGTFEIASVNGTTAAINWNDTIGVIQTKVQAVTGQSGWTVTGSLASQDLKIVTGGTYGDIAEVSISANSLDTAGIVGITFVITETQEAETYGAAITRTQGLIQYFGAMATEPNAVLGQADVLAAAAIIQPLPVIGFFVSYDTADVAPGGTIDLLRTGSFTQSRGLFYQDSTTGGINALIEMAGYAGRGLSVDFTGSLTTITMNLKQIKGSQPDPNITPTTKAAAITAGADVYVNIGGSPENLCSGKNDFFDNVYNTLWFSGAVQVAYFNYLAQTGTKILQTESGMTGLKSALARVCNQAVANGFLAPGAWNSSSTFGNLTDFYANIKSYGFYIFSTPVSDQSETDRQNRVAPLVQIAIKFAGAIQSGTVIITVNQ